MAPIRQHPVSDSLEFYDPRFHALTIGNAQLEELFDGCRWAEGPVWFAAHNMLVWSDIPNRRMLRWTEGSGVDVYRADSGFTNGNTTDHQGRLVSCEHGARRISRTEYDGTITVIADAFEGKRLNSPNDLVVAPDGAIWFTDPDYGILSDFEGYRADSEQTGCFVYRVDPQTGAVEKMIDDCAKPNGLAFAPGGRRLYVADSGRSHDPDGPHHIRAFDLDDNGRLTDAGIICQVDPGVPDGFKLDNAGNIWTSCGDGVLCFAEDGTPLGKIRIPQAVSNLAFGGPRKNRLFITASRSLYAVFVAATGL